MRRNPPFDPKYTPILNIYMRPCQNLPLPPRIAYPPFYNYMRHSHNSPSLPEYTPFYIKWGSQNLPHLSRIYPHFLQLYATLPESMSPSQNLPPPPRYICDLSRIYQSLQNIPPSSPLCDTPIIYPWPPSRNIPSPLNIYMRHSRNPPPFQNIPLKYSN